MTTYRVIIGREETLHDGVSVHFAMQYFQRQGWTPELKFVRIAKEYPPGARVVLRYKSGAYLCGRHKQPGGAHLSKVGRPRTYQNEATARRAASLWVKRNPLYLASDFEFEGVVPV